MKKLMGDQLHYVHSGDEIRIRTGIERIVWNAREKAGVLNGEMKAAGSAAAKPAQNKEPAKNTAASKAESIKSTETANAAQKRRRDYMKWHRFFAWGTVACFVMTMITGYKRK